MVDILITFGYSIDYFLNIYIAVLHLNHYSHIKISRLIYVKYFVEYKNNILYMQI